VVSDAYRPGKSRARRYREGGFPNYDFGIVDLETDPAAAYGDHHDQTPHGGWTSGRLQQCAEMHHREDLSMDGHDAAHRRLERGHRMNRTDLGHLHDMRQPQSHPAAAASY
jgi:hypothetical protein